MAKPPDRYWENPEDPRYGATQLAFKHGVTAVLGTVKLDDGESWRLIVNDHSGHVILVDTGTNPWELLERADEYLSRKRNAIYHSRGIIGWLRKLLGNR